MASFSFKNAARRCDRMTSAELLVLNYKSKSIAKGISDLLAITTDNNCWLFTDTRFRDCFYQMFNHRFAVHRNKFFRQFAVFHPFPMAGGENNNLNIV